MKTGKIKIEKTGNGYIVESYSTGITSGTEKAKLVARNNDELFTIVGASMQGSYPTKINDFVEIDFTLTKEKVK